ncbi:helix-turn-helix domain-containing protein, partial [Candidatus Woesearchaeota archaeon]|nr:helix-turn-helix domain-containing protein [Candidatus Woesearchaeota archaeon]
MTYELVEVKKIRKKLELTQTQLANRAGVSQSLIAKVESGRIDPTYSKTKKIFSALSELEKKEEIK